MLCTPTRAPDNPGILPGRRKRHAPNASKARTTTIATTQPRGEPPLRGGAAHTGATTFTAGRRSGGATGAVTGRATGAPAGVGGAGFRSRASTRKSPADRYADRVISE